MDKIARRKVFKAWKYKYFESFMADITGTKSHIRTKSNSFQPGSQTVLEDEEMNEIVDEFRKIRILPKVMKAWRYLAVSYKKYGKGN